METKKNENVAKLVGKITFAKKVWAFEDRVIYEGYLQVCRDSGYIDLIPILFDKDIAVDSFVQITGQFRSRDIPKEDGTLKVQLYVYVRDITVIEDDCAYSNHIVMSGYICKKPILRTTPTGKQITDLLVACNYSKDKTAYIPVIVWGREARKAGKYSVGTPIQLDGRIQSRKYTKNINNGEEIKEFIAYELSADHVTVIDN